MKGKQCYLRRNEEFLDVELSAILEALNIASKTTQKAKNKFINVACDSQKAPKAMKDFRIYQKTSSYGVLFIKKLEKFNQTGILLIHNECQVT